MRETVRRLLRPILIVVLSLASSMALAVHVNPRGLGQVLVYPYYTARSDADGNQYNTLFLITNTSADTKAIRIWFRESVNGREVAAVNLFLTPFDSWAVAIGSVGSGARLVAFDQSCFASNPAVSSSVLVFTSADYSGSRADGGASSLDRSLEGYVEAIEMGTVSDGTTLAALNVDRANAFDAKPDCATAVAVPLDNTTKVAPPTGGLTGSAFIVNVAAGTLYSYDATALDSFSGVAMWAPVTAAAPTLRDVNPKASDVVDASGVHHATWDTTKGANPADPVTAVLMQSQIMNYFVLNQGTASRTDWVVTMPTKPFYTDASLSGSTPPMPPFESAFGGAGAPDYFGILPTGLWYPDPGTTQLYDREGRYTVGTWDWGPNPPAPTLYLDRVANVLSSHASSLFASSQRTFVFGFPPIENGWAVLAPYQYPDSPVHRLVSTDTPPQTYVGLPMIGFMANDYVNGMLPGASGPILSNYGATSPHKGTVTVE